MTRSAHQPLKPAWVVCVSVGVGERKEEGESERNKKRQRVGGERERASEGVLPSNMLALMAQTALTFNH